MRRALALFVEDRPRLIANAFWLHASWEHIRSSDTDLVFMGTESALSQLPANVVKIVQQPVADDPSWLDYRYANSLACLNGPGASLLGDYDILLRSDVDVFLTPAWNRYYPEVFTTGRGYYSNDVEIKDNTVRIAQKFGLRHNGIFDIGSTLYGRSSLIKDISYLATDLCKYIRTVEFKDNPGEWPGWYAGVSLLYATEIAVNHLVPSFAGPSMALDFTSTSDAPVDAYPHVHCYHTEDRFSKFRCFDHAYSHMREEELDLGIVRDYCTAMALRAQVTQASIRQPWIPAPPTRFAVRKDNPESAHIRAFSRSRGRVRDWLAHCADPLGPQADPPRHTLSPQETLDLVVQADLHGVLPAIAQNFAPFREDGSFARPRAEAMTRRRSAAAQSLMLRAHGDAIIQESAGLPLLLVKGAAFARTLYPDGLRSFSDIDLLVPPEAEPELAGLLVQKGFQLVESDAGRQEWKWLHRINNALMVEVHTNLVHHPELRAAMSIAYADLAEIADSPAAQLGVAVIHGATHSFERLRNVVDICQAARALTSAEEEQRFHELLERTGARFAAIVGLDLAHRLSHDPRCRELARSLGRAPHTSIAKRLLSPSTTMSTMSDVRSLYSWRRQAFRALLKRSATGIQI